MSDLKWNQERHARNLEIQKQVDAKSAADKAREIVTKEYLKWVKDLLRRGKRQDGLAVNELVQECYRLQTMVANACKHTPGTEDFRKFTVEMLEDKIAQVIATDAGKKNQIVEWLPESIVNDEHSLTIPEQGTFETVDEFMKFRFVKRFEKMDGFVGFIRQNRHIRAMFSDGDVVPVGVCVNEIGILKFPTLSQMNAALADAAAANPGQASAQSELHSPSPADARDSTSQSPPSPDTPNTPETTSES